MLLRELGKIWRRLGVGFFLALIGIGGSLLALSVFPIIALVTQEPITRQRRIQTVLRHSLWLYCAAIHFLRIAHVEYEETERLRTLTGSIIVANHPSLLDVVMIMAHANRAQCVVKAALWRNPFFRLTLDSAGYIPNDLESGAFIRLCSETLQAGNNLIIFPEGTRTVPGSSLHFQRGFANIATLVQADLQLVTITCHPPILHKGNPWWRVPASQSHITMKVGERLDIQQFLVYRSRPMAARHLVQYLENYYAEKLNGSPRTRDQKPDYLLPEIGRFVA